MNNIEKISNSIAAKISSILNYDKDYEEVLAYGAFSMLQTIFTILLILLFSIFFKVPVEAFIISFTASILRKYSGGVHASTSGRCTILGVTAFVSMAVLIKQLINFSLLINFYFIIGCFGFAYFTVFKNAPKDTPNKLITNVEVRKSLRKKSLWVLHIFLLITVLLLFLSTRGIYLYGLIIVFSILCGISWQAFTLTYIGNLIISNLDKLLGRIYNIGGEIQ
ncbi:accessory regulator AgrB [Alkalibaculum sp. M08DMB]|uniref:Accessory regulator AgrB n=1 Tax=Alkalibaculum sporogenes TaxID=2655001 RepID=A0A6A7K961_9FIRM|nr:accessory gene regulator B family protein [Alkalibaculum sporogenes]MPW25653.1 accessory regulator AgrB [Alkalibaculum sporogenes]